MIHYLKRNQKPRKYEEKLLGSGCSRITNCISAPILGRICYVYIMKYQSYCSRSCTKEFVGVTQEEDLCLTEPSLKDIGSRICRRKPKNMSRSVTNGKGLPQTSINQEGSLILYLILGRLLSGAWILQALSLKRQEIRDTYWSAQTILPNGQKPSPWLTLGMWILRGLSVSQIIFTVRVIQEEDLFLTKPLLIVIGGRVCKRKPKNMLRSVTNAKGLPQTSTNQEGSSILSLVLGRLLSGAWILQAFS